MINNRQAGRRRGRGGNNGGQRQGNPGRPDTGNRIDSRARGNASQLYEKYKNMAADAQRQGDRVNTEYFLQFADHYFRVLSEQRGRFEEQQPRRGPADLEFDGEEEYGDEGERADAGGQSLGGQRQDRDDRGEDGGQDGGRQDGRDGRPRRDDRPRADARDDRPRGNGGDRDGYRRDGGEERPRREWGERRPEQAPVEVAGQRRADVMAPAESLGERAEEVLEADRPLDAPQPRRRGRPRREAEPVAADAANGVEADRLPPSLTVAANDEAPGEPKPRRRRARVVEDTPTAAE